MSQYQICFSGAAKGASVELGKDLAFESGRFIAASGHHLLTGATTGLPNYAAQGAKDERGMSIGLSPAANLHEHVHDYMLPTECYDIIFYTGQHFIGRDVMLVLRGAGGTSEMFRDLLEASGDAAYPPLIESDDPDDLVRQLTKILDEQQEQLAVRRRAHLEQERQIP